MTFLIYADARKEAIRMSKLLPKECMGIIDVPSGYLVAGSESISSLNKDYRNVMTIYKNGIRVASSTIQ